MTGDMERRRLLAAIGAVVAGTIVPSAAGSATPTAGTGKPGDFDFLTGEWRIANRMRQRETWIEFPGEATVRSILKGVCSIEELRIPVRDFSGMGLRLLDMDTRIWSDHWVDAKAGVVGVPGQTGGFRDGVGTFTSTDEDKGTKVIYRGVWDRITPTSCRWRQGVSRDGGASWDDGWFMAWTRVG